MTPEQFQRVERLFEQACGLAAQQRGRFLDEHCTDELVRCEVQALLAEDGQLDPVTLTVSRELAVNRLKCVSDAIDALRSAKPADGRRPLARTALMIDEASYTCGTCGEEIVIPIDPSAGGTQEYVEDCPVCCRPNVVHVHFEGGGAVRVWAESE